MMTIMIMMTTVIMIIIIGLIVTCLYTEGWIMTSGRRCERVFIPSRWRLMLQYKLVAPAWWCLHQSVSSRLVKFQFTFHTCWSSSGKTANCLGSSCDWCLFTYRQGDPRSWKDMEFSKTIFQAWKVMEKNIGHGHPWKMIVKSWNFYNCFHKLLTIMYSHWFAFSGVWIVTSKNSYA